jgi:SAM-dependent methyltransferase
VSICRIDAPVIYQHPLAYLLGLEGVALLRAFSGVYDRDFMSARLREIRTLLNSVEELGGGVEVRPIATREGYAHWASFYDEPGNRLLDLEPPVLREILGSLPLGVALDTACGTGRHTAYVASLGHKVIGVDTSPEMLALAREKVPQLSSDYDNSASLPRWVGIDCQGASHDAA